MDKEITPLTSLPYEREAKIVRFEGGYGLQHKLRVMGVREGHTIKIVSRQPLRGPLTVEVNGGQITLGRGLAQKIMVEMI
jgi:ferrous iron transport protein A